MATWMTMLKPGRIMDFESTALALSYRHIVTGVACRT
jgi:hypothetical protein